MQRQVVTPLHLVRLPCVQVVYVPQNLQTTAIQATRETMGAMALEFGCEIGISHPNYRFLNVLLERVNPKGDRVFVERTLSLGEWLVVLEDEVHIFPEDLFGSTFTKAEGDSHGLEAEIPVPESTGFMTLPDALQHQGRELPDLTA